MMAHVFDVKNSNHSECEEVIEKLFPKCRPRSFASSNSTHRTSSTHHTSSQRSQRPASDSYLNNNWSHNYPSTPTRDEEKDTFNNNLLISFEDDESVDNKPLAVNRSSGQPSSTFNLGLFSFSPVKMNDYNGSHSGKPRVPGSGFRQSRREVARHSEASDEILALPANGDDRNTGHNVSPIREQLQRVPHSQPPPSQRGARFKQQFTDIGSRLDQLLISPSEERVSPQPRFNEKPLLVEGESDNSDTNERPETQLSRNTHAIGELKLRETKIEPVVGASRSKEPSTSAAANTAAVTATAAATATSSSSRSKSSKKRMMSSHGNYLHHSHHQQHHYQVQPTMQSQSSKQHSRSSRSDRTGSYSSSHQAKGSQRKDRPSSAVSRPRLNISSPTNTNTQDDRITLEKHSDTTNLGPLTGSYCNISSSSSSTSPVFVPQHKVLFPAHSVGPNTSSFSQDRHASPSNSTTDLNKQLPSGGREVAIAANDKRLEAEQLATQHSNVTLDKRSSLALEVETHHDVQHLLHEHVKDDGVECPRRPIDLRKPVRALNELQLNADSNKAAITVSSGSRQPNPTEQQEADKEVVSSVNVSPAHSTYCDAEHLPLPLSPRMVASGDKWSLSSFSPPSMTPDSPEKRFNDVDITERVANQLLPDLVAEHDADSMACSEPPSPAREPEIARLIGSVPIAKYEGSPRRYGPKPPGYPQRVLPTTPVDSVIEASKECPKLVDITCDELVKSILSIPVVTAQEELSSSSSTSSLEDNNSTLCVAQVSLRPSLTESNRDSCLGASGKTVDTSLISTSTRVAARADECRKDQTVSSDKLLVAGTLTTSEKYDTKLHEIEPTASAYVGKRLACTQQAFSTDETSSHSEDDLEKREPALSSPIHGSGGVDESGCDQVVNHEDELLLLHERVHQHILQELTVSVDHASVSTCTGTEAEVDADGEPVDGIRNFTLSPETTDCDSNEIESEFSLGGSSGSRLAQMPVLEDGLSSGLPSSGSEYEYDSGNDEGPLTLDFMKKQISEIEEEIKTKLANARERQRDRDREREKERDRQRVGNGLKNDSVNEVKDKTAVNGGGEEDNAEGGEKSSQVKAKEHGHHDDECDTDQETDRLLGAQRTDDRGFFDDKVAAKKKNASREGFRHDPAVLIEGVLFRARYLGSTQLVCEGQPTKATRMMQAEEAVSRIKAPEGETQPSTEVDLFISTEKIMVLNTDLKEIMMDHALRTISYIADIGDLLVLMARRRVLSGSEEDTHKIKRTPKMICHVFESEEAQFIAQSIGQAFQVAYMEFLKANGIEDSSFVKEMDYQEVLNSQEIFGNELEMFAKKDRQKEVIVPKQKNEILGMVIVESGWGSMLPTVVIANMAHGSPASRCGLLNIGDQIIAINGVSLVGLPLSSCQNYIKNTKMQTAVKLTVVPCAPVVEVKIKRPDTKYQLGFSVQNGVICSLLRGGIAERGGVRVGHRIIEINGQSVVAVPHERIVNLLATSVGEICMKTMPTSMFRLLTGQETPVFI